MQEAIGNFFSSILHTPGSESPTRPTAASRIVPVQAALSNNPRYDTYYRHLSLAGHGTPLWLPEPNETRGINYRRRGAAIGDVVFFTANGALDFLFNICLDADDPINGNKVPEGFSSFKPVLTSDDLRRSQEYGEDGYLASKSITKQRDRMGPAGLVFLSSASEGAILTMPEGAYSEDLARVSGFDRYLAENLDSWYQYINEVREWGVQPGKLHLVTGVHKAKAWGIATFSNETVTAVDLRMRFKSNGDPSTGSLYSWEYEGIVDSPRTGPTRRQREAIFEGIEEAERQSFENQCLFVRTVNATARNPHATSRHPKSHPIVIPTGANSSSNLSGPSHSDGPNPSSFSRGQPNEADATAPDQSNHRYNLSIMRNGPVLRDHPSKAINDFLLKEKPNGRIAITHDHHWISLLTEDDVSLPSAGELITRLKNSFKIIEEEGVISLEYPNSNSDIKTTRSPEHLHAEDQSTPNTGSSRHVMGTPPALRIDSVPIPDALLGNEIPLNAPPRARMDNVSLADDSTSSPTFSHAKSVPHAPLSGLPSASTTIHQDVDSEAGDIISGSTSRDAHNVAGQVGKPHSSLGTLLLGAGAETERGRYGDELQEVAANGDADKVRLLLEKGADVNAEGGYHGNALQAASFRGHATVVKLLLENGAQVNAHGGRCDNALQAASIRGHETVLKLLLEQGADMNAEGERYGTALHAASFTGHEAVVKLLLEKGADVNAQGEQYGSALQAASFTGHEAVVKLLLEKGADVNGYAHGERYGSALQVASTYGHSTVVKLLLENGAQVNEQGGPCGNALQTASANGHEAVVKLLLEKGADVNAQGGHCDNALQIASFNGHDAVVKLLLEQGADMNAGGERYDTALQVASAYGKEAVVKLLLEMGADVNARGGKHGSALQAEQYGGVLGPAFRGYDMGMFRKNTGHETIAKMLLEDGANDDGPNQGEASYGES